MLVEDSKIKVSALGQTGFYFEIGDQNVLIDPYLSDYVQKKEGDLLKRLVPIPIMPEEFERVDWLLITHAHIDHCDPDTVIPLVEKFENIKILGPLPVHEFLRQIGVKKERLHLASNDWMNLGGSLNIKAVPAAHPDIKKYDDESYECVGYLMEFMGKKIYHSGDTSVCQELIDALQVENMIDVGFISVNERNYYRDQAGIIGNMSVREAFQFAIDAGVRCFVPMHWDMFEVNCVYKEEIELLYNKIRPDFRLEFDLEFI